MCVVRGSFNQWYCSCLTQTDARVAGNCSSLTLESPTTDTWSEPNNPLSTPGPCSEVAPHDRITIIIIVTTDM